MSCKNTLYSQHFGPTRAQKAPKPCEELNFFRGEHRGGHPRIIAQAWPVAEWWILWLDPLQTGSLLSGGFCQPSTPPARRQTTYFLLLPSASRTPTHQGLAPNACTKHHQMHNFSTTFEPRPNPNLSKEALKTRPQNTTK